MTYEILEQPLTREEIEALNGEIDVVISVAFNDIQDFSYADQLDLFEQCITESSVLSDIQDRLVGCDPDNQTLHIRVIATVEDF